MRVNRHLKIALFFFLVSTTGRAVSPKPPNQSALPKDYSTNENSLWFPVGEELVYDIYWGVVPVGHTRITTSWEDVDGRKLIAIRYITKTEGMINKMYPVDDLIESLVDPKTFLPARFTKSLKEGKYRCHEVTTFNHKHCKAHWESKTNGRVKDFAIEKDTRDVVSMMYYLRAKSFQPDELAKYRVMADEKMYDLQIQARKEVNMKLKNFGDVPCIRLDPKALFQGIFVRKGSMTMWVSQDERHLCTRMMAVVPVANIRVTLSAVNGPGEDFWVKPQQAAIVKSGDKS